MDSPAPHSRSPQPDQAYRWLVIGLWAGLLLTATFGMLAILAYPAIETGSLLALGGLALIFACLLVGIRLTRTGLEHRLLELSTLNEVSQVLRSSLDLDHLLGVIQTQVTRFMSVDNFYVALLRTEDNHIWYPLAVKHGQRQTWPARPLQDRLTDRVIRNRNPLLYPRLDQNPGATIDLPAGEETPTAWIGVPLVTSERAIGCLALFSFSPHARFSDTDLELLNILSGQVSVAIENALVYRQARQRAAQLETLNRLSVLLSASLNPQEVLAQVCVSAIQVGGADHCAIFLLDQEDRWIRLAHTHKLSGDFIEQNRSFPLTHNARIRCLRTGKPVLVTDIDSVSIERKFLESLRQEGIFSFGDFPLVTPDGKVGFLTVYFDSVHAFTEEELDLLQTYAYQAALAVTNARLYARTDLALSQRAHQLAILEAVGRELAAASHSGRLFEMILNYACEFTNSPRGTIGLYNPANHGIEVRASLGHPEKIVALSVDQGVTARAIQTRQPAMLGDGHLAGGRRAVGHQPSASTGPQGEESQSQLAAPLLHEGRVLGVITLEKSQSGGYSPADLGFISQLATQAAISVVNAELYTETQRRLREQSTLYLVSTHLSRKMDLAGIAEVIQRAMHAALDDVVAGVYLWDAVARCYNLLPIHSELTRPSPSAWSRGKHTVNLRSTKEHLPASISEADLGGLFPQLAEAAPIQLTSPETAPAALSYDCDDCLPVVFPMTTSRQRLGLLLLHLPDHSPLQAYELQLLHAIVSQATTSLQSALLFTDVTHGRDRLNAVLNSVREGILLVDTCGQIVVANQAIETVTGYAPSEFSGKSFSALEQERLGLFGYSAGEAASLVSDLNRGRLPEESKATLTLKEAALARTFERHTLPVTGDDRSPVGLLVLLRDTTEEHQIAEARELITETLIHDIRSPLSTISGAFDILEQYLHHPNGNSEVTSRALQIARRSSGRVLGLVDSLLDIARMQSGSMELSLSTAHLPDLAATALAELAPQAVESSIHLLNQVPDGLPLVCADANKLVRILSNLLDNALKFTPTGGQVILSAEQISDAMLVVRVSDTGPGIPEAFREKIFERFTQVPGRRGRRRGSGLGLTFCQLAVEAHGGRIWVEPHPGGGSVFSFTLPIHS